MGLGGGYGKREPACSIHRLDLSVTTSSGRKVEVMKGKIVIRMIASHFQTTKTVAQHTKKKMNEIRTINLEIRHLYQSIRITK